MKLLNALTSRRLSQGGWNGVWILFLLCAATAIPARTQVVFTTLASFGGNIGKITVRIISDVAVSMAAELEERLKQTCWSNLEYGAASG